MILYILISFWIAFFIGLSSGQDKFVWPTDNIFLRPLLILLSPIIYTISIIVLIFGAILELVNDYTQIKFFFDFFIRRKYKGWSEFECRAFSRGALGFHGTKSIPDRVFRYGVYLINKRNHHYVEYYNEKTGIKIKKTKNKK